MQNVVKQAFTETSASGTELTINNTIEARMEMKLNGNTSQNGEPTPDKPQEIHCVKGNNVIKIIGKNMLDSSKVATDTSNGITLSYDKDTQIFTLNGTCTADNTSFALLDSYYINQNKTKIIGYYISGTIKNYIAMRFFKSDYSNSLVLNLSKLSNTNKIVENTATNSFLSNAGQNSIRIDNGTTANNFKFKLMLTDSDDTEWKPYQGSTYPISLGNMELCKIDDYQDYIYKQEDKWYKHKVIEKANNPKFYYNGKTSTEIEMITDQFSNVKSDQNYILNIKNNVRTRNYRLTFRIPLNLVSGSTEQEIGLNAVTYINSKTIIAYYILATPIEEEITDTTLITQLDGISQALSKKGTTIISQNNDDLPFNLDVIALTK